MNGMRGERRRVGTGILVFYQVKSMVLVEDDSEKWI